MEDLRATFLTLDTSLSNAIPYLINLLLTTTMYLRKYLLFLSSPLPEPEQEEAVSRLLTKKEIMWVQSEAAIYYACYPFASSDVAGSQGDSQAGRAARHSTSAAAIFDLCRCVAFIVLAITIASK